MKVCIKIFIHIDDETTQLSHPMWIKFNSENQMVVETIYIDENTAQDLTQDQFDQIIDELIETKKAIIYKVI